ncbi:AMP-binding protein [Ottowia sp.]|uniref:AMP-binding protein n=1 Tax=Ottowia sp. TaxID=1898956 RepID=UPI003C75DB34
MFDLARIHPDKTALRFLPGAEPVTFIELAQAAAQAASWMLSIGLQQGDTLALLCENRVELLAFALGARRIGLYYTPISTHLRPRELTHILVNSGAKALVTSIRLEQLAHEVVNGSPLPLGGFLLPTGGPAGTWPQVQLPLPLPQTANTLDDDLPPAPVGRDFLYSSGTTGLPSGIRKPMVAWEARHQEDPEIAAWRRSFGFDQNAIYFSPAPLYHAAPLRYAMRVLECGGSCILMDRFDAESALAALNDWHITHSQWVPTMFSRMLALPPDVRARAVPRDMRAAIHAAAPCPPAIKRAMIDWWGPVIYEYYAGSEGIGMTAIDSHEWLAHPGSVGKAKVGTVRITDDHGNLQSEGQTGTVWFEGGPQFAYHADAEKTARAYNSKGWASYGDIGHLDSEGYLYLSDRRADLILSGGVNIYPREVEDILTEHPSVADAAVIGIPDDDMGEVVKAFVKPRNRFADETFRLELASWCRERLSGIKIPRVFEFREDIPRLESGKLLRRRLREQTEVNNA